MWPESALNGHGFRGLTEPILPTTAQAGQIAAAALQEADWLEIVLNHEED